MSFITSKTYVLAAATNYTPGAGIIDVNDSWVLGIHILDSLTGSVTITHSNGTTTVFGIGSLIKGAVYYYSVKSISFAVGGDAGKVLGLAPNYKTVIF